MVTLCDNIKQRYYITSLFCVYLRRKNANEYNTGTKEMARTRAHDN